MFRNRFIRGERELLPRHAIEASGPQRRALPRMPLLFGVISLPSPVWVVDREECLHLHLESMGSEALEPQATLVLYFAQLFMLLPTLECSLHSMAQVLAVPPDRAETLSLNLQLCDLEPAAL